MFILFVLACCLPSPDHHPEASQEEPAPPAVPPPPALPARPARPSLLGTPATSEAARPAWAEGTSYAPQSPAALASSPVETSASDGMLRCEIQSYMREMRFRKKAAKPDLQGYLSFGRTRIFAAGSDDNDRLTISAPLARLGPGDSLRIDVQDRQPFSVRSLGTMEAPFEALPASLTGEDLAATCVWIEWAQLEAALETPLADAEANLRGWHPAPNLESGSLGPAPPGEAAQAAITDAAALVGWDDPRVASRVAAFDERLATHRALLAHGVQEKLAGLPEGWVSTAEGVQLGPATLAAPRMDAASRTLPRTIELPVRLGPGGEIRPTTIGPLGNFELVDARGERWGLRPDLAQNPTVGGEPSAEATELTAILEVWTASTKEEPALPGLLRARDGTGHAWFQRVEAAPAP